MKNLLQGSVMETSNKQNCTVKHQDSDIVYIKTLNQHGFRHASSTMKLMLAFSRITEGMKGTQLSLAIVL